MPGHGLPLRGFVITPTGHTTGLLWTSDQPDAETSTWQHTTHSTDRHPCPRWDSNPQSQQASGPQTHNLDRSATWIGHKPILLIIYKLKFVSPIQKCVIRMDKNLSKRHHKRLHNYNNLYFLCCFSTSIKLVSLVKPNRCTYVLTLFSLEWQSTCSRRSCYSLSGVQDCTYSNRYCCMLDSKQSAVSVWHMPVAVCTVLNSWTNKPFSVVFHTNRVFHNVLRDYKNLL